MTTTTSLTTTSAIPDEYRETLKALVHLDEKLALRFVDALKAAEPHLLMSALAPKIASTAGLDKAQARGFLLMLSSMSRALKMSEQPIDKFLALVRDTAVEEAALAPEDVEQWPRASKHLAAALRTKAIEVSSKALAVMTSNERMFCHARVLSDLRTIFTADLEPAACVVLHQLKIAFHKQEDYDSAAEIFVTMDHEDLLKLKTTVDRALKKHDKLQAMAKTLNLQVLSAKAKD